MIATQNPVDQEGTYPLSEAQTDRFMLKEIVRYPSPEEEVEVMTRIDAGIYDKSATQRPWSASTTCCVCRTWCVTSTWIVR